MAKATGSRGGSSKTEVSVCAEPSSADSQIGNAEKLAKGVRRQRATVAIQPCPTPSLTDLPRAFLAKCSIRSSAFLTETDAHLEIDVTLSKQKTENFLTGARIAISVSRKHISNRELVELEHAPTH
jgi:hypothetical protein